MHWHQREWVRFCTRLRMMLWKLGVTSRADGWSVNDTTKWVLSMQKFDGFQGETFWWDFFNSVMKCIFSRKIRHPLKKFEDVLRLPRWLPCRLVEKIERTESVSLGLRTVHFYNRRDNFVFHKKIYFCMNRVANRNLRVFDSLGISSSS